jgi:hypothetical protein
MWMNSEQSVGLCYGRVRVGDGSVCLQQCRVGRLVSVALENRWRKGWLREARRAVEAIGQGVIWATSYGCGYG